MEKITSQQYRFICELIWGGVPIDKIWAMETSLFKNNAARILNEYPMLDKSFFQK